MRITDLLPTGTTKDNVTVLIDAKDQSVVSYSGGTFTIRKGTPGVTATIRKTNYADVKLTFVINEIDAEAQRVSNTGIVSGSVKEGFKLDGLKKDIDAKATQIMFTVPKPGTKYEIIPVSDKAAQFVTCEELKNADSKPTGVFQFTWKADATADVVYNIKADGYKAVTVTISATKLSKRALLEAFKEANKTPAVPELEVYGDNATLTLVGSTPVQLKLQIKEGNNDAKDLAYTYSDTTGAVVKMEKDASGSNNAYTFTAVATSIEDGKEPTLTIKYPGYEDATVKVKVVNQAESESGSIYLYTATGKITEATPYVLENLVVGATTGTDVTFRTTDAADGTLTTALIVTPSGHDQEAVEVTVSGGKATFKAKKYVKDGALFTFKATTGEGTYKAGTIKVTTAEVGKLIDYLPKNQDGFTVTDETGSEKAALALSVGNPVTIRFSDKIDITAADAVYNDSNSAKSILEIEELGGGSFKFTAKGLMPNDKTSITFTLSADGYTAATVTVTIKSLEEFLQADTTEGIKLAIGDDLGLTMVADGFEKTGKEILKNIDASTIVPDGIKATLEAGSGLGSDKINDYVELKSFTGNKLTMTAKQAEVTGKKVVLRLSQSTWGHIDIPITITAGTAMTLAKPSAAADDVQYADDLATIAVPYNATQAGSYKFTAKGNNNGISGLEVSPVTVAGVTGISAAYDENNGEDTITVPKETVRGTSQVLTLKAPGYTPVKVTVSVKKLLIVEASDNLQPTTGTTNYTIESLTVDENKLFTVTVGENDTLKEGPHTGSGTATVSLGTKTADNKYSITVSAQSASTDEKTFILTCPGYDDIVIKVTKSVAAPTPEP